MTRVTHSSSSADAAAARDQFAADVRYYLTQEPRQLPSRYLYDDLGSALFDAICRLPWYPLARSERRLLDEHAREALNRAVSAVIELGPGSGEKLAALLDAGGSVSCTLDLHLVDVSAAALRQASRTLEMSGGVRHVRTHQAAYEVGLGLAAAERPATGRVLLLFLGSNVGNFDPPGREAFVRTARAALRPGDLFLLGADLVKAEKHLLLAYDDPLGITAAFNRNLLVRINRELAAHLPLDGFAHRAVWNERQSRVEMHLVSRRHQRLQIAAAGLDFTMDAGESIWTESSYKFEPAEIAVLLERCGFRVTAQWIDAIDRFALTLAESV